MIPIKLTLAFIVLHFIAVFIAGFKLQTDNPDDFLIDEELRRPWLWNEKIRK